MPYRATWTWASKSNTFEVTGGLPVGGGLTLAQQNELKAKAVELAREKVWSVLAKGYLEKGITITIRAVQVTPNVVLVRTWSIPHRIFGYVDHFEYRVDIKVVAVYETDHPIAGSPIDPITIATIGLVLKELIPYLIAGLVAIIIAHGIAAAIQSLTTIQNTVTVEEITYDPLTGKPIKKTTKTETITQPSPLAIGSTTIIIIVVAILLIVGFFGISKFLPKRRRK